MNIYPNAREQRVVHKKIEKKNVSRNTDVNTSYYEGLKQLWKARRV